jgi:PhnB protein
MPKWVRAIIPMLVCQDGAAEIEFCKAAFGAVELSRRADAEGSVRHATLGIGENLLMVHGEVETLDSQAPRPDGSSPVVIYLYLEGVDAVIKRAVAAGARILLPVEDAPWGDRVGRILDPEGHVWNIASRVEEQAQQVGKAPAKGARLAWQIAIVADEKTALDDLQGLMGQMPVWALRTRERKAALPLLAKDWKAMWTPDPAITLFTGYLPEDPVAEIVNLIPTIEERHPGLAALRLVGIEPSEALTLGLAGFGYAPVAGTHFPGLGFAKPLDWLEDVGEIVLDAHGWRSGQDFYNAFFAAVGAPSGHGRNFDAIRDSIATGAINRVEIPYRIKIGNTDSLSASAAAFVQEFADLIRDLQSNGCPVELLVEHA